MKIESNDLDFFAAKKPEDIKKPLQHLNIDPDEAGNGLVKLVLSLVEVIRELIEKQALRKIERETLSDPEIEKLGLSLMRLEEKMEELKNHFNLTDEDLQIDLGVFKMK